MANNQLETLCVICGIHFSHEVVFGCWMEILEFVHLVCFTTPIVSCFVFTLFVIMTKYV